MTEPTQLLSRIRSEFPGVTFSEFQIIEKGWDHTVVILDNATIFRFPRDSIYAKTFKREVELLRVVQDEVTLPVPVYTYMAKDQSFGGYPIISGVELTHALFENFDSTQQRSIAQQVGRFLTQLHSISLHKVEPLQLDPAWKPQDWKEELQARHEQFTSFFMANEVKRLDRFIADFFQLQLLEQQVVLHYDFADDHILVDPDTGSVTGIIDFGDAALGDPVLDFSWLWELGEEFITTTYQCYEGPKDENFLMRAKQYRVIYRLSNIYDGMERNEKQLVDASVTYIKQLLQENFL